VGGSGWLLTSDGLLSSWSSLSLLISASMVTSVIDVFYCAQSKGVNYEITGESLTVRVSVS
jgi:hypothetical protein